MKRSDPLKFYAIVHNVRSLHNVGSIFRTADAAGVERLYLTGYTPGPLDRFGRVRPEVAKVALGAESHVPWIQSRYVADSIKNLKTERIYIVALEQYTKAKSLFNFDASKLRKKYKGIAFVVGNEVRGLPASIIKQCDAVCEIPMHGKKESLNVSVAFGIAAFAFRGQL